MNDSTSSGTLRMILQGNKCGNVDVCERLVRLRAKVLVEGLRQPNVHSAPPRPLPHLIAQQAAFFLRYGLLPSIRRSTSGARSRAISDGCTCVWVWGGRTGLRRCQRRGRRSDGRSPLSLSPSPPSSPFLCRLPSPLRPSHLRSICCPVPPGPDPQCTGSCDSGPSRGNRTEGGGSDNLVTGMETTFCTSP